MKNCFIIHGSFGNNRENWFGWLEDFLTKKASKFLILITQLQ